jgi:hypothetical protein
MCFDLLKYDTPFNVRLNTRINNKLETIYSLRTSLCLQVIPPVVSAVCLALSAIYFDLPTSCVSSNSDQGQGVCRNQAALQKEWYELMDLDLATFKVR